MVLRRSAHLPARLVFPPGMEELQAQLEKELKGGTLFEADFSLLDGIKANIILCSQQHMAAPLVMLKLQPDGKLLPMVIQGLKGEVEAGGGTRRAVSAECWRQSSLQGANAPSGSSNGLASSQMLGPQLWLPAP
ncbi:uncharacterized protein C17orf100 homolog isoform X1 [Chlorocebus sabaeus]|uniref:uncharacterized protein C17orf100 homolog isoform X1 n=1 Tax=Chlorocebus sabaeus TaxID=60711 RepID=UPI00045D7B40|nr:uncharacterized protein C17orf100 homolog isoform X1 [Chlorocebus sabaeus]